MLECRTIHIKFVITSNICLEISLSVLVGDNFPLPLTLDIKANARISLELLQEPILKREIGPNESKYVLKSLEWSSIDNIILAYELNDECRVNFNFLGQNLFYRIGSNDLLASNTGQNQWYVNNLQK